MDFMTIGTVGSFVKQKNLTFAANYKIKTGQSITDTNGNLNFANTSMFNQVQAAQSKKITEADKIKIESIRQKLLSGKKLSNNEMAYLREKDTKLYKKAKSAEDAREELKTALKSAKTKQEARQAITQAMIKASAETSAEIAAFKAGGGANVTGGNGNLSVNDSSVNLSVNENLDVNVNINTGDTPATIETNSDIANNNFNVNSNENVNTNNDNENNGGQFGMPDIIEKFIMKVRALQDEWEKFTKTDKYDKLPEFNLKSAKLQEVIDSPNPKVSSAVLAYRKSMNYRSKL